MLPNNKRHQHTKYSCDYVEGSLYIWRISGSKTLFPQRPTGKYRHISGSKTLFPQQPTEKYRNYNEHINKKKGKYLNVKYAMCFIRHLNDTYSPDLE